jgi:hypothetical protein
VQEGFALYGQEGQSLRDFMRGPVGMSDAYIEGSVSTVFLDYKPVDDLDGAVISPGCLVSLSAAMPGLVGAVMRRNSPYASFREAISHGAHAEQGEGDGDRRCIVRVKLFNAVMREHGPLLVSRGILLEPERIMAALGTPLPPGYASEPGAPGLRLLRALAEAEAGGESQAGKHVAQGLAAEPGSPRQ